MIFPPSSSPYGRRRALLEEAQQKVRNVKLWRRDLDGVVDPVARGLNSLRTYLDHELPGGIAHLVEMQRILESYSEMPRQRLPPRPGKKCRRAPMSSEGEASLAGALQNLTIAWEEVRGSWRDAKCAEFEEQYLKNLPSETRQAIVVMTEIDKLLQKAKQRLWIICKSAGAWIFWSGSSRWQPNFAKREERLTRSLETRRGGIAWRVEEATNGEEQNLGVPLARAQAVFDQEIARIRQIARDRAARVRRVSAQSLRTLPRRAQEARGNWLAGQQMRLMHAENARAAALQRRQRRRHMRRRSSPKIAAASSC